MYGSFIRTAVRTEIQFSLFQKCTQALYVALREHYGKIYLPQQSPLERRSQRNMTNKSRCQKTESSIVFLV